MKGEKDPAIAAVVARLRQNLGDNVFDIVDHWDGDRCAIGIAAPSNHAVLVYITTF